MRRKVNKEQRIKELETEWGRCLIRATDIDRNIGIMFGKYPHPTPEVVKELRAKRDAHLEEAKRVLLTIDRLKKQK